MFAAVDIWDAVRSDRPYRSAWSPERARAHIASLAGTHLDPAVTPVFLDMVAPLDGANQAGDGAVDDTQGRMSGRVLVVDDVPANVTLFQRWLAGDGYDVVTQRSLATLPSPPWRSVVRISCCSTSGCLRLTASPSAGGSRTISRLGRFRSFS